MTGEGGAALADRYGRTRSRRRRPLAIAAGAALAVAVAAWAVWTGVGGAVGALDLQTDGYDTHPSSMTVRWRVGGPDGQRLVCAVEALNAGKDVVGLKAVPVRLDGGVARGTTEVRIVGPAVSGLLSSCRRA